jgi:phosphatidylserine synthase
MVHRMPTVVVAVALVVLLVAGLALPWAWAGILLIALGLFLGWLLALSWPIVNWAGRTIRALAVLALLVMGVLRLMGKF